MIDLCTFESEVPVTERWAKQARERGGFTASHDAAIINYLNIHTNFQLAEFCSGIQFLIYGAWLELCLGNLMSTLLVKYSSKDITLDLNRSISREESPLRGIGQQKYDLQQRKKILFAYHPVLLDYKNQIKFIE